MTIEADTLMKALTLLLAGGSLFYTWVMSQGKAYEPKFKELADRLESLSRDATAAAGRIAKVEGEMTHLPDKDTVHRIELGMKDMQSRIDAQGEVVKAVERTMTRVEEFLLQQQNRPAAVARARK